METKHCSHCERTLPRTAFRPRDKSKPDGYVMSRCADCVREIDRRSHRTSAQRNAARRERLTGWGEIEYGMAKITQRGRCAICSGEMRPAHSDHCHDTGQTRALLCGPCNKGLGMFADDPARLRAAASYIERHRALHADEERVTRRGEARTNG